MGLPPVPGLTTVSARCHDSEANNLALNLMHDIVTERKAVQQARDYYGDETGTPYMKALRLEPQRDSGFSDRRILSDEELAHAKQQGERKQKAA